MAASGLEAQQLVELLAVVSSCRDEESAIRAAAERAAETIEAEIGAVIIGGAVVTAVGLPRGVPADQLTGVAPGQRSWLEIPKLGSCSVGSAALGGTDEGLLVVGRLGEELSVAEGNLIRGMARVLGLTLRMLRTLDAERRRQRLMQSLYQVQQAISRRAALPEVLQMTTHRLLDIVAGGQGRAELWLTEPGTGTRFTLTCGTTTGSGPIPPGEYRQISSAWPVGAAVLSDQLICTTDTLAAPVHEHGHTIGGISVIRPGGHAFGPTDAEHLLALAEHVSLALSDAKAVREINEALHDSLTALPGRALFLRTVRDRLADEDHRRLTVLFVDLDLFKQVNDTLGHAAGDALLVQFAARLRQAIGPGDLAARLGGDEFAVCLGTDSPTRAVDVARQILADVVQPFAVPGGSATVGASVGIAVSTAQDRDESDLIRRADVAMYHAKQNGRGNYFIYQPASEDAGGPHQRLPQNAPLIAA